MMLHDIRQPHRVTFSLTRQITKSPVDLDKLDQAGQEYIRSKVAWSTLNNDETMINLIGSWSRLSRIMREMEQKYAR